jgi:hypothetical protein
MQQNKTIHMKTAMQELIEYLESRYFKYEISSILLKSKELLEKEKEQIIDAANQKIFGDITFTGSDEVITKGENYYNQTYNQNK